MHSSYPHSSIPSGTTMGYSYPPTGYLSHTPPYPSAPTVYKPVAPIGPA